MQFVAALRWAALAGALAFAIPAQAQSTYKCRNEQGRITYSSQKCEDLGLAPAGAVKDLLNTAPAYKPPPRPPAPPAPPKEAAMDKPKEAKEDKAAAKDERKEKGERRCFVVGRTKDGAPIMRCNETPEDDDARK